MLLRTAPLLALKLGVTIVLAVAAQQHFTGGTRSTFATICARQAAIAHAVPSVGGAVVVVTVVLPSRPQTEPSRPPLPPTSSLSPQARRRCVPPHYAFPCVRVQRAALQEVVGAATAQGMLLCVPILVSLIVAADGSGHAACALSQQVRPPCSAQSPMVPLILARCRRRTA